MHHQRIILKYLLLFLAAAILLKITGAIEIKGTEIVAYCFTFYGAGTVYSSFGNNEKGFLFLGTFIFFSGLILIIMNHFYFARPSSLLFPSIFFIAAAGFLMIYIDNAKEPRLLLISILFFLTGFYYTFHFGSMSLRTYWFSLTGILKEYWFAVLLAASAVIILSRRRD